MVHAGVVKEVVEAVVLHALAVGGRHLLLAEEAVLRERVVGEHRRVVEGILGQVVGLLLLLLLLLHWNLRVHLKFSNVFEWPT